MKKILGIITVTGIGLASLYASGLFWGGKIDPEYTLPHIARMADIAGIAKFKGVVPVTYTFPGGSRQMDFLTFEVEQLWLGTTTNQVLAVYRPDGAYAVPPLDTDCVVLVNTNYLDLDKLDWDRLENNIFGWDFITNRAAYVSARDDDRYGRYGITGTNSFFRADADGGKRLLLASNLVHHARIAPDEAAFLSTLWGNSTNASPWIAANVDEFLMKVIFRETKGKLLLWYDNPGAPQKYRDHIRSWLINHHDVDPLGILRPLP